MPTKGLSLKGFEVSLSTSRICLSPPSSTDAALMRAPASQGPPPPPLSFPVEARVVVFLGIVGISAWIATRTDAYRRTFDTSAYWSAQVASAKQAIEIDEFSLRDFNLEAERHQRTAEIDVAQEVGRARLVDSSPAHLREAREAAVSKVREEAETDKVLIRTFQQSLAESRVALDVAQRAQEEALRTPPEDDRRAWIATAIVSSILLACAIFGSLLWKKRAK